jgi:SnoaL-like domain
MTGEELRDKYFSAMRGADLSAVLALFSEDAVAILPDGKQRVGKAALEEMFAGIFGQSRPNPSPGPITGAEQYWAVEVETALPDGRTRNTANFFRLNDAGLIKQMHSYMRS